MKERNQQLQHQQQQTNQKRLKDGGIVAGGNLIPILGQLSFHKYKTYTLKNH